MSYPLDTIRAKIPSLKRTHHGNNVVFFDGPSGSQVAQPVIDAMVVYMENSNANLGSPYLTSIETDQIVGDAREAMADFLGGRPDEIAFGQNMTSLAFALAGALSKDWQVDDNIVVTELDHMANVDTWSIHAEEKSVSVRKIPLDTDRLELDYSNLDTLIDDNTRLVAIGHASNGVGTVNDLKPVVRRAREVGAIVVVDAVHSAPHLSIDREELDADIIICSAYKFFGPHIGIATIRQSVFEQVDTYRISTAPQVYPGKLETGTQSFESMAGLIAVVEFIANLGDGETRKERISSAFDKIHEHESRLAKRIREFLTSRDEVTIYQSDGEKTPTIAFRIEGIESIDIVKQLDQEAIFAGAGHFYAKTIAEKLELDNGWVRIGMAPYTSDDDVDRFIAAIESMLA